MMSEALTAAFDPAKHPHNPAGPGGGQWASKQGEYPAAGDVVDGRAVRDGIPNQDSIEASLSDWTILPGVREVPMSDFPGLTGRHYSKDGNGRIAELAEQIEASKEISPLIVVVDAEGPYILEGATRSDALKRLDAKSFPAMVVIDEDNPPLTAAATSLSPVPAANHEGLAVPQTDVGNFNYAMSRAVRKLDRVYPELKRAYEDTFREGMDWAADQLVKLTAAGREELIASNWDPAKHPHRPVGEAGGQWAPTYATFTIPEFDFDTMDDPREGELSKAKAEVAAWPGEATEESAKSMALSAIDSAEGDGEGLLTVEKDRRTVGVVSYHELEQNVMGGYAGAIEGSGLRLFDKLVSHAAELGKGLRWSGTRESSRLYTRLGLPNERKVGGGWWHLTPEQVQLLDGDLFAMARSVAASAFLLAAAPPEPDGILNPEQAALTAKTTEKARRKALLEFLSNLGVNMTLANPMVQSLAFDLGRFAGRLMVPGLQEAVRDSLKQSYADGLSVPDAADALREVGVEQAPWRAEMMARTDLNGLANGGSLAGAQLIYPDGLVAKRWLSAHDDRVRPDHVEADGQVVPLEQAFQVGDDVLQFPGDPNGSDLETCNCRCTVVYVPLEQALAAAGFDPAKHPHRPAGTSQGGQFAPTTGDVELLGLMSPFAHGQSINVTWSDDSGYEGRGEWKMKPEEEWRAYRPDEPHVYADDWPSSSYTAAKDKGIIDTSPPNPKVAGLSQAIKLWIVGKGRDAFPWWKEMRTEYAVQMGLPLPDELSSSDYEHGTVPAAHEVQEATSALIEGINQAPPSQPALWRGMGSESTPGWSTVVAQSKPGDTLNMLPASWSRDYSDAQSYANGGEDSGAGLLVYALPGSKGVADKARNLSDDEVITAGDFEVVENKVVEVPYRSFIDEKPKKFRVVTVRQRHGEPVLTSAAWIESEHTRVPAGSREGGQFGTVEHLREAAAKQGVSLNVSEFDDGLLLHMIQSTAKGEGHASAVLNQVGDYADSVGKPVFLTPAAVGEGGLSTAQLERWYRRHGFETLSRRDGRRQVHTTKMIREPVTASAVTEFKGSMVSLPVQPDTAEKLAVEGGQNPETLHVTLAFLSGEADQDAVRSAIEAVAHALPLEGTVNGIGKFAPGDEGTPLILIPSAPGLLDLRKQLVEQLTARGVEWSDRFEFQPHITLTYLQDGEPDPKVDAVGTPLVFNSIEHRDGDVLHYGAGVTAAGFDPALHPHKPGGDSTGGQWAPKIGSEAFRPEIQHTDEDQIIDGYRDIDALWEKQTARALDAKGGENAAVYIGDNQMEKQFCKQYVQDNIADALAGDADFLSLHDSLLANQGGNASWADVEDQFPNAVTPEQQTAALAVANWARTSSDSDPVALQFQEAAIAEFGISGGDHYAADRIADWEKMEPEDFGQNRWTEQQKAGARKFLRAQYNATQAMFAEQGIKQVTLYRGMRWQKTPQYFGGIEPGLPRFEKVSTNPLSSWAYSGKSADMFTTGGDWHAKVGTVVDTSRILSTPFTGFGCLDEHEMVVLGGDDVDAFVMSWSDRHLDPNHTQADNDGVVPEQGYRPSTHSESEFDRHWVKALPGADTRAAAEKAELDRVSSLIRQMHGGEA